MDVEINEVVSTVRAVDGQALLSPQLLRRLVEAMMQAVNDHREHEERTQKENRVTGGVSAERDQEE
jgi:hypothetical protein